MRRAGIGVNEAAGSPVEILRQESPPLDLTVNCDVLGDAVIACLDKLLSNHTDAIIKECFGDKTGGNSLTGICINAGDEVGAEGK